VTVATIEDSARRCALGRWWELKLFELLGAWVATVPELEVKACLATQSLHHGWHAELWSAVTPGVAHLDGDRLPRPGPALEALADALEAGDAGAATIERLVGVYGVVLPGLVAEHRAYLERAETACDGPLMRVVNLILADELADLAVGERLLGSLLVSSGETERATRRRRQLQGLADAAHFFRENGSE